MHYILKCMFGNQPLTGIRTSPFAKIMFNQSQNEVYAMAVFLMQVNVFTMELLFFNQSQRYICVIFT